MQKSFAFYILNRMQYTKKHKIKKIVEKTKQKISGKTK